MRSDSFLASCLGSGVGIWVTTTRKGLQNSKGLGRLGPEVMNYGQHRLKEATDWLNYRMKGRLHAAFKHLFNSAPRW